MRVNMKKIDLHSHCENHRYQSYRYRVITYDKILENKGWIHKDEQE